MQINSLAPSNITEPKGAAAVAVPPPVPAKTTAKVAPAEPKKDALKPSGPEQNGATAAAKTVNPDITDVKPTGEKTEEGEPTFALKVNGREYKATQSEIIALAQKARGAEAAMKQKAEIEKLASDLLTNFDNDTFGLLVTRHGKEKAKEIAISMVKNLIAEEAKDPKDLELEELRAKAKRAEEAEALVKKQKEEDAKRLQQRELYGRMLREIDTELDQTHLPKDKLTLTRVLNYLSAGKKANGQAWTIKDAVKAVEVEDMGHASYYAKRYVEGKLPSDKFREIFGDETFKKLNKEQIDLLKKADKIAKHEQPKVEASGAADVPKPRRSLSKTKGSDGISEREYRRQFGSLGGI